MKTSRREAFGCAAPGRGRPWAAVALCLLAGLSAGCSKEMMDAFVDQHMTADHCVNWADEGRIFVLQNGCYDLATETGYSTSTAYLNCTMAGRAYEPPWPRTPEPDVEVLEFGADDWRSAARWVREYRWITVNPSFTAIRGAVAVAATQLKVMHRRGVVLVYLPHGPDATRVDFGDRDSREDEANRYICGGYRTDHAQFRETLGSLLDEATAPAAGRRPIHVVVSAYSYSGPPTLEVVRDNADVFFVNVAPNFGWAQWRGSESHDIAGHVCNPFGKVDSYHELKYANPRVRQYMRNLAFARVPQCLIASRDDGVTIGFRGFAVNMREREAARLNDPEGLRPPREQLDYDPYDPNTFPPQEYCANAEPGYAGLKRYVGPTSLDAGGDPFNDSFWEWPTDSSGRERTETCYTMAANLIASWENDLPSGLQLPRAFQANAQTVNTLRILMPRTPTREEDLSYGRAVTATFQERSYYGHIGYWMNGNPPPSAGGAALPVPPEYFTANLNFREALQECVAQFEPRSCPSCEEAYEWAYGRSRCCRGSTFWP